MKTRLLSLSCVIALCGPTALLGCGGDDTDGTGLPPAASETVSAETGGDVETTGAGVSIPAGALDSDVMVTIEPMSANGLPDADTVASPVFDFGPDGTQFSKPVELELEFDTSMVTEGKKAVMAYLDGDSWVQLDDSIVSGNKVTASTTHFTPFAIIIVGGVGQVSGSCEGMDFTACGGDLVGTWEFTLGCATLPLEELGKVKDICQSAEISLTVDLTGEIEFKSDKTYSSMQNLTLESKLLLPRSCIGNAECAELNDEEDEDDLEWTDVNGVCQQSGTQTQMNDEAGTYATDGGELTLTSTGEEGEGSAEYCVKGDNATVRVEEEGLTFVYQIKRK
jgi:hypothetical protein